MIPQPHKQLAETEAANHLELPARLTNLPHFIDFVRNQACRLDFPPKQIQEIELVLEEALVNIIKYAYPTDSPGNLTIMVTDTGESRLHIETSDHGIPFNPLTQSDPDVEIELMERPIGGLGILLIKELTDELSWDRKEGKNSLTLIFAKRHA